MLTPEELGRIAFHAMVHTSPNIAWDQLPKFIQQDWIAAAIAVAAAVKREDAEICEKHAFVRYSQAEDRSARKCAERIRATIPEGK